MDASPAVAKHLNFDLKAFSFGKAFLFCTKLETYGKKSATFIGWA
jgi:hypothetical protein